MLAAASLLVACGSTTRGDTVRAGQSVTPAGGSGGSFKVLGHRPTPIVYRPLGLSRRRKVPLVVALYGATGCPQCMEGLTKFEGVAREHGFVVAYPGSDTDPPWHSTADISYFRTLIDRVTKSENIDPKRVYVAGFSAGGRETYYAACKLSSRIAAIAVVSSVMRGYPCRLSHPISELTIGGSTEPLAYGNARLPSLAQVAARWRVLNGCPAHTPAHKSQVANVSRQTWGFCKGGSVVAVYLVQGGRHNWPRTSGLAPSDPDGHWDASTGIWSFFAAHPLRH
jgi:polyhydroxybutyrate depolymerase